MSNIVPLEPYSVGFISPGLLIPEAAPPAW